MPKMKNSGVEWIGEIPANWNVIKNKHFIQPIYSGGTPTSGNSAFYSDSGTPFVTIADMSTVDVVHSTKNGVTQLGIADKKLKVIPKGTLIYSIYATVGEVAELGIDATINQALLTLTPNEGICNKDYYKYNLKAMKDYIFFSANKNTQYNLNAEKVRNFLFVLPPLEIQKSIANFLDKKCSEIGSLSADIQSQIDVLEEYKKSVITEAVTKGLNSDVEMKNSEIKFVSEIPLHWLSNKMNRVCSVITDYVASGSFADLAKNVTYLDYPDYAMLIRTADISGKGHTTQAVYIDESSYNFLNNSNLFGGEIILPNIGASVGDVYIVPKLYERMSLAPNSIMIKTKQVDKYFYYFFMSNVGRKNLIDISGASAQAKFNKTDLRQMKVPQPPIEEQKAIISFLDNKCAEIDAVIADKKAQLETLAEYKKSLIYEYVTGKKEVPDNIE